MFHIDAVIKNAIHMDRFSTFMASVEVILFTLVVHYHRGSFPNAANKTREPDILPEALFMFSGLLFLSDT